MYVCVVFACVGRVLKCERAYACLYFLGYNFSRKWAVQPVVEMRLINIINITRDEELPARLRHCEY